MDPSLLPNGHTIQPGNLSSPISGGMQQNYMAPYRITSTQAYTVRVRLDWKNTHNMITGYSQ